MNHESFRRANLRSADTWSFKVDPLAFTEEAGFSNQSRPSSTEAANQQKKVAGVTKEASVLNEISTFESSGVIFEKPYQTPALEMGARWFDKVDPLVM